MRRHFKEQTAVYTRGLLLLQVCKGDQIG